MAKLYITEYSGVVSASGIPGRSDEGLPVALEPGSDQVVTYTTSTASTAFDDDTNYIRVISDSVAHISFGASPSATVNSKFIPANAAEYFGVQPGDKIAAYDGSS